MSKVLENYKNNQYQLNKILLQNLNIFKKRFEKISNDINILESINNNMANYYNKSKVSDYLGDLRHIFNISQKIMSSIFNLVEPTLNNNHNVQTKMH